jgi:hypothetical protein
MGISLGLTCQVVRQHWFEIVMSREVTLDQPFLMN